MDLLRARKAAHWSVRPIGYLEALKNVYRSQGELAMFNGLKPTLLGIVPYAGSSFAFFETMKDRYVSRRACFLSFGMAYTNVPTDTGFMRLTNT